MKKVLLTGALALATMTVSANEQVLRVATDGTYPPFSEMGADGELMGFDIDITYALCEQMQRTCEIRQMDWDGLIPALKSGKTDAIIASMNATEERRSSVIFTEPYYSNPGIFLRPKGSNIEFNEAGLKGKVVGVLRASIFDTYVTNELADWVDIQRYGAQDEANLDAQAGRVDVLFADELVMRDGFLDREIGTGFEVFGPKLSDPEYFGDGISIAVRLGEQALADEFSQAIKAIRANGVYQTINNKYFDYDVYAEVEAAQQSSE